ncbi:MAG: heterodisulfide reductase subunit A [Thermoprotei archaeon ex4572_64]|nr:MAG: heterodisulfide reductase subunit A [Thermoprotei archaeon ex4572_64]
MKIGVYICTCKSVTDVIPVNEVVDAVSKIDGVVTVKTIPNLCVGDFSQVIEDIKAGNVERVVIAGCSPRYVLDRAREVISSKTDISPYLIEVAPIREHAAWAHRDNPQAAKDKAINLIKAYVGRVKAAQPIPKEVAVERVQRVLVIGAGPAGLSAALELADLNIETIVVEKKPYIGGKVVQLARYFPKLCPPYCGLEFMLRRLRLATNPLIRIYTNAEVLEVTGSPGNFKVKIRINPRYVDVEKCNACGKCMEVCPIEVPNEFNFGMDKRKAIYLPHDLAHPFAYVIDPNSCIGVKEGKCTKCVEICPTGAINLKEEAKEIELNVGAIIVATGWEPYDPYKLSDQYGFGKFKGVITNMMLERLLAPNGPTKGKVMIDGKVPKRIVFIQCAGSRDEKHLPYCSTICCAATLKHVLTIAERHPDVQMYVLYIDVRAFGLYEDLYKKAQALPNVFFIRGRAGKVEQDPNTGELIVIADDTLLGERIAIRADMVVLATGMVSSLRVHPPEWLKSGVGRSWEKELLQIPRYHYFAESDYICFPFESKRTGIYVAGSALFPMDVSWSVRSGIGAAMRAASLLLGRARTEYSYLTDPNIITIDTVKCTQCKRCTEECPFDTYTFDEKGYPKPDPLKCRRCGICVGACPAVALSLPYHNTDLIMGMIKSLDIKPDKFNIIVFACVNDAYAALDIALRRGETYPEEIITVIPVPCIGSVNVRWLADSLSLGIDGILLMGCRSGEATATEQCHFIRGPDLASVRMENLRETLSRMAIEVERVKVVEITLEDYDKVIDVMKSFVEEIKKMGPNPFKGFGAGAGFGGGMLVGRGLL